MVEKTDVPGRSTVSIIQGGGNTKAPNLNGSASFTAYSSSSCTGASYLEAQIPGEKLYTHPVSNMAFSAFFKAGELGENCEKSRPILTLNGCDSGVTFHASIVRKKVQVDIKLMEGSIESQELGEEVSFTLNGKKVVLFFYSSI